MKKKATRPTYDESIEKPKYKQDHKPCKHCGMPISQELIKGIWIHEDEDNPYDCKLSQPTNESKTWKMNCKSHNYKLSKHSDAMMCPKCKDVIHKRDFFTNRNVYWCRIHNMRFTNVEYHRKKYHVGKVAGQEYETAMDYVDYTKSNDFEIPKVLKEDGKRLWSDNGHGYGLDISFLDSKEKWQRYDVHVIDYGFISQSKFAKIIAGKLSASSMNGFILGAGNDKDYIRTENREQIHIIYHNRTIARYNHAGEIQWVDKKLSKDFQKELVTQFA